MELLNYYVIFCLGRPFSQGLRCDSIHFFTSDGYELNKRTEKLAQQTIELYQKLADAQEILKNQVPLPEIPLDNKQNGKQRKTRNDFDDPALLGQQPPTMSKNDEALADAGPNIRVVAGSGEDGKAAKGGNNANGNQKPGGKK